MGFKKKIDIGADKQVIRGSSLIGPGDSGVPTLIDVKDGKITRIRPLNYEMNYDRKDFNAWKIEARASLRMRLSSHRISRICRPPLRPVRQRQE